MSLFEKIKQDLVNFPDEVIKEWILPYANMVGWPPINERWKGIFHGKTLEFWKNTKWEKQLLDLTAIPFSALDAHAFNQMRKAYVFRDINNIYNYGEPRFKKAFQYILCSGRLPGIVSLLYENNEYSVVDGANRFVAWLTSKDAITAISTAEKSDNEELKNRIIHIRQNMEKNYNVSSIAPFSSIQEVWVATP